MTTRQRPPKVPRPTPVPRTRSDLVDRLAPEDVEMFWTDIATTLPLVESTQVDGEVVVTFCWRDAAADEVLLFANRLTDERNLADTLLERKPGTDLWHASFTMRSDWRASYAFLVRGPGRPAPWETGGQVALRAALDRGLADPRNPETCLNRAGAVQSVVALPDAAAQPWLAERPEVVRGILTAESGPAGRAVWLYDPPGVPESEHLPLVVVLDGEVWTRQQSMPTTLDNLIADGMAPVRAVLVASGDRDVRWAELGGADGAAYVAEVLVPWARSARAVSERVIVAGQSLGGLTALRAGLRHPDVVTDVVSQSASLWMDDLADLVTDDHPLRVHLAHGTQEWVLAPPHEELAERMRTAGMAVTAVAYNGGHDYAWWRGAVADALRHILRG